MTNNTRLKVTPGSRSNFNKLKKYKEGGDIPKLQTSWKTLDKSYLNGLDTSERAKDISTWDDYYNTLAIDADVLNHAKNWTIDLLNDSRLYDPNLSWSKTPDAKGYQNWNTAFNALLGLNGTYFGSDENKFKYLGPTTWNRHTLLNRLLTNHSTLETAMEISNGQKVYWDLTQNKWVPVALKTGATGQYSPYESVTYTPPTKTSKAFDFPFYPAFNAAKLANGLITNLRNFNLARQKQVPLQQASVLYDKVTGDYTYQTALQQKIADNYSMAAQLASGTSNADQANAIQLQALKQNDEVAINGALHLDLINKQEIAQNQAVATANNLEVTRVSNNNLSNLVGLHNMRLNDKMSFNNTRGELLDQFMTSMRADDTLYNRIKALNELQKWLAENSPIHDENIAKIQAAYKESQDKSKYYGWQDLYNFANTAANENVAGVNKYLEWVTENQAKYGGTANSFEAFKDYASGDGAKNVELFRTFNENWDKYKKEQKELYMKRLREEASRWNRSSQWPIQISGEMPWWMWQKANPLYTAPYLSVKLKSGGTVDKLDRFLKYMEHNHKIEKDQLERVFKYLKQSLDILKRDLDALDRETLLLLRSIFK